jgi:hypothetical protein
MPHLGDKKYFQFYRMRDFATKAGPVGVIRVSREQLAGPKKSGLKTATLISASNPVSQVLW